MISDYNSIFLFTRLRNKFLLIVIYVTKFTFVISLLTINMKYKRSVSNNGDYENITTAEAKDQQLREKSTKNQQNGNVNIKGKRVALEAEVEQRDTDVKGKRIALETEINQRDEDIKGKLTALDAENQKLRDKVIEIEQQYNKYQELTTLYCKFPNNQIPENVKIVIKKCKLDKILDVSYL
ncbi:hypothetical protein C2G38_1001215 [Gigaspora rosea]|uniref:Uncharacterized protein n=1 Tax=Gigaspora rosea TaxID=44941 RepID=A0A397TX36_9GLOM|nr:hypothetical protein C2G38_1001215 [Gigaspora rosea]